MNRCSWTGENPLLVEYHDKEWGVPLHDDQRQFEYLSMEVMQCGLSWLTVLKRREVLRSAFENFAVSKVAGYGDEHVDEIMKMEGMIHSPRKNPGNHYQCKSIPTDPGGIRFILIISLGVYRKQDNGISRSCRRGGYRYCQE